MRLYRCVACGHVLFPARALCHRCGGAEWAAVPCPAGTVETVTVVRHGTADGGPVHLATVRTPEGVRVVARLAQALEPGVVVALDDREGAVWARRET